MYIFIFNTVQEDPTPAITQMGPADSTHFIEFMFNVSSTPGTIQRIEVRVYHKVVASIEDCDTTNRILLKHLQ